MKYTKESLEKITSFPKVKEIAKGLGIATAGQKIGELKKAILKKQGSGKDDAESVPGMALLGGVIAKFLVALGEACEIKVPAEIKKAASGKSAKPADDEEEEDSEDEEESEDEDADEDEEEEEESDDEEEEEDKPKKGKGKKKPADDDEEEDEEVEEEEDGDEEEEELELTPENVAEMNLARLKEVAAEINKATKEKTIKIVGDVKVLRKAVLAFVKENAEDEEEEEEEESDDEDSDDADEFVVKKGIKCWAFYDGDWYVVKVKSVKGKMATCYFEADESEAEVEVKDLAESKPKGKSKK